MTNDELVLSLSVGLLTLAALGVGLAAVWLSSHRGGEAATAPAPGRAGLSRPLDEPMAEVDGDLVAPRRVIRERVVRVVALSYLVAVAVVVAVSGGWGANAPGVYVLVALGTFAVVFLGDLVPDAIPSTVRGWAEAAVAILLVTAIVGLTGGVFSPFVPGYFLIVAATGMSRDTLATVAVAFVSAFAAAAVDLLVWPRTEGWSTSVLPAVAFLGISLVLLAAVVATAAREHARAQDATLRLARFDPLTGLYNRAHFFTELEREIRLSQRAGRTFALVMMDVDGLKPVNDEFGHHYGDRLLTGVTGVIRNTVRATDTPARYGGDEFLVLLPETDAAGAYVVAEKLRHDIAAFSIQVSDRTIRTSVSVGLVAYPEDGTTADALITSADAALYEAKRSGRDRIVGYTTRMERVATAMGGSAPRTPGPIITDQGGAQPASPPPPASLPTPPAPAPAPLAPESAPSGPRVVASGAAPWVTGTTADWESRGRARIAVPVGSPGGTRTRTTDVLPPDGPSARGGT